MVYIKTWTQFESVRRLHGSNQLTTLQATIDLYNKSPRKVRRAGGNGRGDNEPPSGRVACPHTNPPQARYVVKFVPKTGHLVLKVTDDTTVRPTLILPSLVSFPRHPLLPPSLLSLY